MIIPNIIKAIRELWMPLPSEYYGMPMEEPTWTYEELVEEIKKEKVI